MSKRLLLRIFTNQTCSLCVEAKEALKRVNKKVPFDLEEVDINKKGNEEYLKYCFDVPVINLVSNESGNKKKETLLMMHRVDEIKMIDKLNDILKNKK